MVSSCFFIPLCASDVCRVKWTIRSIKKHCSDYRIFVIPDGFDISKEDLDPEEDCLEVLPARTASKGDWGKIWQNMNDGMLHAMHRSDLSDDCIFVRMDADAMIVRDGLAERAQRLFSENPKCGQLGQCYHNIAWHEFGNAGWRNYFHNRITPTGLLKALLLFCQATRSPILAVRYTLRLRKLLLAAFLNGYPAGKFCQGGAYILRRETVSRMAEEGWLIDSPMRLLPAKPRLADDLRMAPHIYSVGYEMCDDVREGGIFAICAEEPYIHPIELCQRGHYIIHSTKYGTMLYPPYMSEEELAHYLLSYES